MTQPFIGEIQLFGFNFAPVDWAMCNGTTMSISQNTALFSLLGTTYGGNGTSTFQLPNLVARAACNQGQGQGLSPRTQGEIFGESSVTLGVSNIPSHSHGFLIYNQVDATKRSASPSQGSGLNVPHQSGPFPAAGTAANTSFSPQMLGPSGQGQPHENNQPALAINYCVALYGVFPSFS